MKFMAYHWNPNDICGDDEIKLVRKKLNWNYKPFEIPKKILNEWRKIGNKGYKIENRWNKNYKKKNKI